MINVVSIPLANVFEKEWTQVYLWNGHPSIPTEYQMIFFRQVLWRIFLAPQSAERAWMKKKLDKNRSVSSGHRIFHFFWSKSTCTYVWDGRASEWGLSTPVPNL